MPTGVSPTVTGLGGLPLMVRNAKTLQQKTEVDDYVTRCYYGNRLTTDQYNELIRSLWGSA